MLKTVSSINYEATKSVLAIGHTRSHQRQYTQNDSFHICLLFRYNVSIAEILQL